MSKTAFLSSFTMRAATNQALKKTLEFIEAILGGKAK
jgi:hypothetical protein